MPINVVNRRAVPKAPEYFHIPENYLIPPVDSRSIYKNVENKCECTEKNPCGPNDKCLNRNTLVECDSNCSAKNKCQNRRFTQRTYAQLKTKFFESKGWGLITLEDIQRNEYIVEYVGEVINRDEYNRRIQQLKNDKAANFYFLELERGLYIDSAIRGNDARFINHSCKPNCNIQKWIVDGQMRIGVFASVDIPKVSLFYLLWHAITGVKPKDTQGVDEFLMLFRTFTIRA